MSRAASSLRRRRAQFRTGSLLCPGIDPDEFAQSCRAPVFNNHWNVWRLYRTTRDNPTDAELRATADAFLAQITKHVGSGSIPHIQHALDVAPSWAEGRKVLARREDCSPVPMLKDSPIDPAFRTIWLRFVYRGSATSMPWPVRKISWIGAASACPVDADWILDRVLEPDLIDVPAEGEDPILPPAYGKDLPDPKKLIPKIGIGLGIAAVAVAAVAGAYVLRSAK